MTELFIFNQDDKPLTIISEDSGLISSPYRIEVNKIPETPFSFTVEADSENAKYVLEENKVVFRDHEGDLRLFVIKELDDSDGMDGPLTTATCEPEFLELTEHIILDKRFSDKTAQVALDAALEGTGWIGEVEVDLGLASTNFYRMRSVDAIWEIIKVWGGEFKDVVEFDEENNIVARKIKIIQRLGKDTGQRFEIDHNTTEIGRQVLSYPVTAMYGWGASLETEGGGNTRYIDFGDVEWSVAKGDPVDKPKGQKWVGDPEAFASYRRIRDGVALHRFGQFSNQDYEDPEELLWATWDNLQNNNKPVVNYRLFVDLFDDKVSLGDTAIAIDRKFARPIEIQSRIIAMEYDLLDIDGTMVVEMGQFLDLEDDRLEELKEEVEKIRDRPQQVTEGSFPDIKPTTPLNVEAISGYESIQLYWDYDSSIYVKHYEVYGSQIKDFIPDTQHLLWRGNTSGYLHKAETNQIWYFRVRAVNQHGTPSDWSVQVNAPTRRIIDDETLFGPDGAEKLRELSEMHDTLGDSVIRKDMIRQDVYDQIQADSKQYTDAEITATEVSLMSELANKAGFDYVDGKIYLVNEELINKVDNGVYQNKILQIDNSLDGLSLRAQNVEANVNELTGEVGNAISQIAAVDIKANKISTSVNELRSDFNNLEIGGRNLIKGSDVPYTFPIATTTFVNRIFYRGLERNTTYTFSAEIEVHEGNVTEVSVYPYLASGQNMTVIHAPVVDGKIVATFTTDDRYDYNLLVYNGRSGMTTGNSITVSKYKLEKGNKATDWTPAPEDIESRVSSAETRIDQTAYDLTFKASTQEVNSLTGRMTSAESSIKLLSDDIELKVDRDGIIGAINVQPGDVKIHTRLLDVGDFTNLVDNGTFEDDATNVTNKVNGWINENPSNSVFMVYDQTTWGLQNGSTKTMVLWANSVRNVDVMQERYIQVSEGDELYFEWEYRNHNTAGTGRQTFGVRNYSPSKEHHSWGTAFTTTTKTVNWTKMNGSYKVPAGVGYIRIRVTFENNGETSNRLYVDNLVVRRKNNAALIVDGSITANLMAANSITAQNGALANASITRAKLQDAIIGTAQIDDLAVTAAKISSINADKINSGAIRGIDIYGAQFRSNDGLTQLDITGGNVRLRQNNGRYVLISPDGLFGYNAGGDIRFQADKTLVTSSAFGTSNQNVYLAAMQDGEARVVDYRDVPSDGAVDSYRYLALRASGVYANFVNVNGGINGIHLYLRPFSEGEVRVTRNGTIDSYRPLRVNGVYGDWFDSNTATAGVNLYIRPTRYAEVRFTDLGTTDGYTSIRGSRAYFNGIASNTLYGGYHLYLGADGEARATSVGFNSNGNDNIIWRNFRGNGLLANFVQINELTDATHLYLRMGSTGEARVTRSNSTETYQPIRASEFRPPSSKRDTKKNIEKLERNVLDEIRELSIYKFNYKFEEEEHKRHIGVMLDEVTSDIVAGTGDTVDFYSMIGYSLKGIKDVISITDLHADEINWLKIENQYLKQTVVNQEKRIAHLEGLLNVA